MPERIAALFHFHNGDDLDALEEALEHLTNRRLPPTRILLVCSAADERLIKDHYCKLDQTTLSRLNIVTNFLILPYDSNGRLIEGQVEDLVGSKWGVNDEELLRISLEGLKQLIDECGVVLKAPRGYVFRKPSGNANRNFIRTGNLFRDPASLGLLSYLLMRYIPCGVVRLYIDSFTILSAALAFTRHDYL